MNTNFFNTNTTDKTEISNINANINTNTKDPVIDMPIKLNTRPKYDHIGVKPKYDDPFYHPFNHSSESYTKPYDNMIDNGNDIDNDFNIDMPIKSYNPPNNNPNYNPDYNSNYNYNIFTPRTNKLQYDRRYNHNIRSKYHNNIQTYHKSNNSNNSINRFIDNEYVCIKKLSSLKMDELERNISQYFSDLCLNKNITDDIVIYFYENFKDILVQIYKKAYHFYQIYKFKNINHNINCDEPFRNACMSNKFELAKYIYSKGNVDIHSKKFQGFNYVCLNNNFNFADWFISIDNNYYYDILDNGRIDITNCGNILIFSEDSHKPIETYDEDLFLDADDDDIILINPDIESDIESDVEFDIESNIDILDENVDV